MKFTVLFLRFNQIIRRVNANRLELGFNHPYFNAVLNRTQLFQLLGHLQKGRRHGGKFQQEITAIDIQSDMLVTEKLAEAE